MYDIVKSCIKHKEQTSDFVYSNIGVKQGDPRSTLLFLYFINDNASNINVDINGLFTVNELKIFLFLFADDAVLFVNTLEALQSMLNDLYVYCNMWDFRVNTKKTKIMIFEKGRHTTYNFIYGNVILDIVTSFKYLGMYLFKNENWYRTEQKLAQHSYPALHNIFIVFNQLNLNISDKCKLFDSLVGPVLNYAAEVWGNHNGKNIESVHCKFIRKILCVKKSTNIEGLYGEVGRYPMYIRRMLIMIKYWIKIVSSDHTILKTVYHMLRTDVTNGNTYNKMN